MVSKYDDASWHFDGDFPETSPIEYGGTHIALFLKWCFVKGWAGEADDENHKADIALVVVGEKTATEFLFEYCDGKLTSEDLNDAGNQFATKYYGNKGRYFNDYVELFGDLMYVKPEKDHDFEKLSELMESRLKSGNLTKNPFWKFWAKT